MFRHRFEGFVSISQKWCHGKTQQGWADYARFAPSPTGYLHIGHAFSALTAFHARGKRGTFHLRIEDIDPARCKPKFTEAILEDLAWLGLDWEKPVRKQSEHMDDYDKALRKLTTNGLLYPCFCTGRKSRLRLNNRVTRRTVQTALSTPVFAKNCRTRNAKTGSTTAIHTCAVLICRAHRRLQGRLPGRTKTRAW